MASNTNTRPLRSLRGPPSTRKGLPRAMKCSNQQIDVPHRLITVLAGRKSALLYRNHHISGQSRVLQGQERGFSWHHRTLSQIQTCNSLRSAAQGQLMSTGGPSEQYRDFSILRNALFCRMEHCLTERRPSHGSAWVLQANIRAF